MLTTQADRFSAEEVHRGLFTLITIIKAKSFLHMESEKTKGCTSSWQPHTTHTTHTHTFSCKILFSKSQWIIPPSYAAWVTCCSAFFCWLDGADVYCLPPWCVRKPGLQESGSHHYSRRGKGSGVNFLCLCQIKKIFKSNPRPVRETRTISLNLEIAFLFKQGDDWTTLTALKVLIHVHLKGT